MSENSPAREIFPPGLVKQRLQEIEALREVGYQRRAARERRDDIPVEHRAGEAHRTDAYLLARLNLVAVHVGRADKKHHPARELKAHAVYDIRGVARNHELELVEIVVVQPALPSPALLVKEVYRELLVTLRDMHDFADELDIVTVFKFSSHLHHLLLLYTIRMVKSSRIS